MNLVMHDATGFITQVIVHSELGIEKLSQRYLELGIPHIKYEGHANIQSSWVCGGVVRARPLIEVVGIEDRPLAANGEDAFHIQTVPPCTVTVKHGETTLASETLGDGKLELSVSMPGNYALIFEAPFPFMPHAASVIAL